MYTVPHTLVISIACALPVACNSLSSFAVTTLVYDKFRLAVPFSGQARGQIYRRHPARRRVHSLSSLWSSNTSANDARQLLTAHIVQHANRTSNQSRHDDTKGCEQNKWHADIFPLARGATPLSRLLRAVLVHSCERCATFALEAIVMCFVAIAMSRAEVCGILTGRLRCETCWNHRRKGEVL